MDDQFEEKHTYGSVTHVAEESEEKKLKYLDVVEVAGECVVFFLKSYYEFAKRNASLLAPVFQAVEDTIMGIIGPVIDKYHYVPHQLLEFLDRKVGEFIHDVDWHNAPFPTVVNQVTEKTIHMVQDLAMEVYQTGLIDAAANTAKETYYKYKPVAKELFYKYEPMLEDYAIWAWWWFNQLPILSGIVRKMLSNAAFWVDRYNQVLDFTAHRGYPLADYVPSIPVERISQVLTEVVEDENES